MTLADARALFGHSAWASTHLLDAAEALGTDAWTRDLGGSFPTLQAVFGHLLGADRVWLDRWTGTGAAAFPAWSAAADPARLRDEAARTARERERWLVTLADTDLAAPRDYVLFSGLRSSEPLGVQMLHVSHHAAYHRGQAAAMIRRLGSAPPSTDLIAWARLGSPDAP